ncbi:MAG: hypothetical protein J6Z01_16655 [Bacteroidales bacterium]|nr:hypothetical protein [Bacteroidales bacterium]
MKSQNNKSNNKIGDSIWLELIFEYIIVFSVLAGNITDGLPFTLKKSHFISGRLIEFDQDVLVVEDKDNGHVKCLGYDFPVDLAKNDIIEAYYAVIKHPYYALPGGRGFLGYSRSSLIIQLKVNGKLVKKYSWYEEHKTPCLVLVILVIISAIHLLISKRIREKKRERKELKDNEIKNQAP